VAYGRCAAEQGGNEQEVEDDDDELTDEGAGVTGAQNIVVSSAAARSMAAIARMSSASVDPSGSWGSPSMSLMYFSTSTTLVMRRSANLTFRGRAGLTSSSAGVVAQSSGAMPNRTVSLVPLQSQWRVP